MTERIEPVMLRFESTYPPLYVPLECEFIYVVKGYSSGRDEHTFQLSMKPGITGSQNLRIPVNFREAPKVPPFPVFCD